MGLWTSQVTGRLEPLPGANTYGHRFIVTLRLHHQPIQGEAPHLYAETPRLVWNEEITSKDYGTRQFFQWRGDLYAFRPDARTFTAWRERYLEAYKRANRRATLFEALNGSATLTRQGQLVTDDEIREAFEPAPTGLRSLLQRQAPAPLTDEQAAQAVRAFIHTNDCELTVEVLDRPAIATGNQQRNVERLLLFDCGVAGQTVRAYQLVRTHSPHPPNLFQPNGNAGMNWPAPNTLPLAGFTPDVGQTLAHQYSDLTSSANVLSFQPDHHLGGGSYR